MKNKYTLWLLTCLLVLNVFGQTQLKKWSISGKDISFTLNQTIAPLLTDDGLPLTFKSKNSVHDNK